MQPILALDLALKTGWAVRDRHGTWTSGVQQLADNNRWESHGMRLLRFRRWVFELVGMLEYEKDPRLIVAFERPLQRGGSSGAKGSTPLPLMLAGALVTICEGLELDYASVPVSTLKKHATGKGNAKKDAMVAAARERWTDHAIEDDNVADALWVLDWAVREIDTA